MLSFRRLLFVAASLVCLALSGVARADERSEKAAAQLLHQRLENESPQAKALLEGVKGRDIVVVRGEYDHIEQVLAAAHIPHTVINPGDVAAQPLQQSQILMVDCPGVIPRSGLDRIQKFVRAGGLLYTTDWALTNVVQKAFPRTIVHNGASTGDEVVPVTVDRADDNLMTKMLLTRSSKPQWWLEGSSYPIRIVDPARVEVLAHSKKLEQRYGASPVVVRFRWEDGQVIHVVSHFYRQAQTEGPAVAAADKASTIEGLTPEQQKDFANSKGGGARMGDVESSYAFQRMTSNLVVGKQLQNKELDRAYDMTVRTPQPMVTAPGSKVPAAEVPAGRPMKVLSRKNGLAQVRDDQGNEGWMNAATLESRH
jgi:hypothetical protein